MHRYQYVKWIILSGVMLLGCVGCAAQNSQFHCNGISPNRCLSLSQVNRLASRGAFFENHTLGPKTLPHPILSSGYPVKAYVGKPLYSGDSIARIWIAPYQDQANNYHEPAYVYTVLRHGHWIADPVKSIEKA